MSNPCIRCGKERIDSKTREVKVGASVMTYTETKCPDSLCQKEVDKGIAERKAKTDSLLKAKQAAKLAREKLLAVH